MQTTSIDRVYADPVTPRHLLFAGLASSPNQTPLAIEWKNGKLYNALTHIDTNAKMSSFSWTGGGIDSSGRAFAYICCFPSQSGDPFFQPSLFKLAVSDAAGKWTWNDLARPTRLGPSSWPPQFLAIAPVGAPRIVLSNGARLFDASADPLDSTNWSLTNTVDELGLSLAFWDADRFLSVRNDGVRRCQLSGANLSCDAAAATGIAAQDIPLEPWVSSADPLSAYVLSIDPQQSRRGLYHSVDGAKTFDKVNLPSWPVDFYEYTFSPASPDNVAILLPAYDSRDEALMVSKDGGDNFVELPLPDVKITSFSGMTFDAAGRLFIVYGLGVYSRAL
jgi:hypothetical protein